MLAPRVPLQQLRTRFVASKAFRRPTRARVVVAVWAAVVWCCICSMVGAFAASVRADDRAGFFAGLLGRVTEARCENLVPPITSGYGADGPYHMQSAAVTGLGEDAPLVFSPASPGRWPVVFFAHGYGPNRWQGYRDIIDHMVSRGLVVAYGTYPMQETNDRRYAALWSSFLAAVRQFGDRMDLTRVGFVGHSLGGGAIPALARRGLVEEGWGSRGAFTFILAPYYAFEATDAELAQVPSKMTQVFEVYDRDTINDHRMAIDLYDHAEANAGRYFFLVRSQTVDGCEIVADHSTPARNPSLRLKQYGVYRPLDALADATFDASPAGRSALAAMGRGVPASAYQPISREPSPTPVTPQSDYIFRWGSPRNPRRSSEGW